MSYAITIRRDEGKPAITIEEWAAVVRGNRALEPDENGDVRCASWKEDDRCEFRFANRAITIDHATEGWERIIGEVAAQLDAVAVGDDGERYLPDGSVVGRPPRAPLKWNLPDWFAFVLAGMGVVAVFAWSGVAIWLFGHFRIGGWGAMIGLAIAAASRVRRRKREDLTRDVLLAFGGATALAGVIAWIYALVVHRHAG